MPPPLSKSSKPADQRVTPPHRDFVWTPMYKLPARFRIVRQPTTVGAAAAPVAVRGDGPAGSDAAAPPLRVRSRGGHTS